jgi:hypothetical protein
LAGLGIKTSREVRDFSPVIAVVGGERKSMFDCRMRRPLHYGNRAALPCNFHCNGRWLSLAASRFFEVHMIKCKSCRLQKKAENCRSCRNLTGKLYLDFLSEVRALLHGPHNDNKRIAELQKLLYREGEMINSFTPENLKEGFKL